MLTDKLFVEKIVEEIRKSFPKATFELKNDNLVMTFGGSGDRPEIVFAVDKCYDSYVAAVKKGSDAKEIFEKAISNIVATIQSVSTISVKPSKEEMFAQAMPSMECSASAYLAQVNVLSEGATQALKSAPQGLKAETLSSLEFLAFPDRDFFRCYPILVKRDLGPCTATISKRFLSEAGIENEEILLAQSLKNLDQALKEFEKNPKGTEILGPIKTVDIGDRVAYIHQSHGLSTGLVSWEYAHGVIGSTYSELFGVDSDSLPPCWFVLPLSRDNILVTSPYDIAAIRAAVIRYVNLVAQQTSQLWQFQPQLLLEHSREFHGHHMSKFMQFPLSPVVNEKQEDDDEEFVDLVKALWTWMSVGAAKMTSTMIKHLIAKCASAGVFSALDGVAGCPTTSLMSTKGGAFSRVEVCMNTPGGWLTGASIVLLAVGDSAVAVSGPKFYKHAKHKIRPIYPVSRYFGVLTEALTAEEVQRIVADSAEAGKKLGNMVQGDLLLPDVRMYTKDEMVALFDTDRMFRQVQKQLEPLFGDLLEESGNGSFDDPFDLFG